MRASTRSFGSPTSVSSRLSSLMCHVYCLGKSFIVLWWCYSKYRV